MAQFTDALLDEHREFIAAQPLFFVATGTADSRLNLSPKGMASLHVPTAERILWLNVTGSGNETAAHVLHDGRMTLMWCSFASQPLILRVYGQAQAFHVGAEGYAERAALLPEIPGARQIFDLSVEAVQTSCGFGVPRMNLVGERDTLRRYGEKKDAAALRAYWRDKNQQSIDGLPTGIPPG